MAKLYLTFEQAVLKEIPVADAVVSIGRLPDNLVQVDNLAVSGHHARISWDVDHYSLEDLASLNGTFLNNQRVTKAALKDGDEVLIGKHTIVFREEEHDEASPASAVPVAKNAPMVPTLDSTVVLDTRKAKEMLAQQVSRAAAASAAAAAAPAQQRTATMTVTAGKTDKSEYVLSGRLAVIGKSDMASIRLKRWFAPAVAATVTHRDGKYFVAASEKNIKLKVNDERVAGQQQLGDGDVVEIAGVKMTFGCKE